MSDYIQDAIDTAGLRMEAEPLGDRRYRVTITSSDRISPWGPWRETITMRPGAPGPPRLGQVLYDTAARLQAVEDTDDFLGWCDETGHAAGDSDTLDRYRDLVARRDTVRGTMGERDYQDLLAALAIDQAISRARPSDGGGREAH